MVSAVAPAYSTCSSGCSYTALPLRSHVIGGVAPFSTTVVEPGGMGNDGWLGPLVPPPSARYVYPFGGVGVTIVPAEYWRVGAHGAAFWPGSSAPPRL